MTHSKIYLKIYFYRFTQFNNGTELVRNGWPYLQLFPFWI